MDALIFIGVGVLIGWLLIERPHVVSEYVAKVRSWF